MRHRRRYASRASPARALEARPSARTAGPLDMRNVVVVGRDNAERAAGSIDMLHSVMRPSMTAPKSRAGKFDRMAARRRRRRSWR